MVLIFEEGTDEYEIVEAAIVLHEKYDSQR